MPTSKAQIQQDSAGYCVTLHLWIWLCGFPVSQLATSCSKERKKDSDPDFAKYTKNNVDQ